MQKPSPWGQTLNLRLPPAAQAHLVAADVRRSWRTRRPLDRVALAACGALLALLFGLTCVEMHVTARHFHGATESLLAVAAGLVVFQAPVSWFMLRVLAA